MHRSRAAALLREVEDARSLIARMAIPTAETLGDVLELSAAEAGFTLETQSETNEGQTTVHGHASGPAALFAWIEMLRKNHGLTISNLTAERENDGTVRVEAIFVRGGS
jgi:type II secretory pathway component PulM